MLIQLFGLIYFFESFLTLAYYIFYYTVINKWNSITPASIIILVVLVILLLLFFMLSILISDKRNYFEKIFSFIETKNLNILIMLSLFVFSVLLLVIWVHGSNIEFSFWRRAANHKALLLLFIFFSIQGIVFIFVNKFRPHFLWEPGFILKHEFQLVAFVQFGIVMTFFLPILSLNKLPFNSDYLLNFDPWRQVYKIDGALVNPVLSDSIDHRLPTRFFFNNSIEKGEFPLWNNSISSGSPFAFLLFTNTFSLDNLAFMIGGNKYGSLLYFFAKLFLLGYFTYLFLRSKNVGIMPSILGIIIASFSTYIISYLGNHNADSVVYLPIILFLGNKYLQTNKKNYLPVLAFVIALTIFTGFPAVIIYTLLFSTLYFVFEVLFFSSKELLIKEKFKKIFSIGFSFIIGILITSICLIPTAEFFNQIDLSYRIGRSDTILPQTASWRIFSNIIYGNPVSKNYYGPSNFNETGLYVGILPFLLFPFAFRKKNRGLALLFLSTSVFIYFTIFGVGNLHRFVGELPLFELSSNTRMLALLPFLMAIISAIGLDSFILLDKKQTKKDILFFIGFVVLFSGILIFLKYKFGQEAIFVSNKDIAENEVAKTFVLYVCTLLFLCVIFFGNNYLKKWGIVSLLAITFLDLAAPMVTYNGISKKDTFFPVTEGINYLLDNQDKASRSISIGRRTMIPSFPMAYSINSLFGHWWTSDGYRGVTSQIDEGLFNQFVTTQPIFSFETINLESNFLNLLRVKYIIVESDDKLPLYNERLVVQREYNGSLVFDQGIEVQQSTLAKRDQQIERFRAKIYSSINNIEVNFTIIINGKTIQSQDNLLQRVENDWFETKFEPVDIKRGDIVQFILSPLVSLPDTRLFIANFDIYPEGILKLNGETTEYDLSFMVFGTNETIKKKFKKVYEKDIIVYENLELPPNKTPIFQNYRLTSESQCVQDLNTIDTTKEVLVTSPNILQIENTPNSVNEFANIIEYQQNKIVAEVDSSQGGIVVLSDTWYPGWQATIDNIETKIIKINCSMRGVVISPGKHVIEMIYKPTSVMIGAIITCINILLCLLFFLWCLKANNENYK